MSATQPQLSPAPPWRITTSVRWLSVREAAKEWRRSHRTIQVWCENGTFIAAGNRVYKDLTGHWWIGIPTKVTVAQNAHSPA